MIKKILSKKLLKIENIYHKSYLYFKFYFENLNNLFYELEI